MIKIGGLQKTTLIDYPGKIACTIFVVGCNFRCPFCYSPELVLPEKIKNQPQISEKELFEFLEKRKGLLEGVVICGGEPTIFQDLPEMIEKIKKMGFDVKLDTNGSNPEMLKELIEKKLLDYVAMDIKGPKEKYSFFSGKDVNISSIEESIQILKEDKVDYEFRTTLAPGLEREDIIKIAEWIGPAKRYILQEFISQKEVISPEILKEKVISSKEALFAIEEIKVKFKECELREYL